MRNINHRRNFLIALISVLVVIGIVGGALLIDRFNRKASVDLDLEEAQTLVDSTLDSLPLNIADSSKYIRSQTKVTVNSLEYGTDRDIRISCTFETIDVLTTVENNTNDLLREANTPNKNGRPKNATEIMLEIEPKLQALLASAPKLTGEVDIVYYDVKKELVAHLSDETVDKVFGGILSAQEFIKNTNSLDIGGGETLNISSSNTLRNGFIDCIKLNNYDKAKPDTSTFISRTWNSFANDFHKNFIEENRWTYLAKGLGNTLLITLFALILGVAIGFLVAAIRCTSAKTGKLKILDAICKVYLAVMRGTPVMIQLLIIYFVLLLPIGVDKFLAAVLCFGINSGAYVSEIMRGGIMSIDDGQTEAGRSLGLGYAATMWHIVIPQAFKAILPSLANEFIALLKETSVAFYIGVADLTLGGLKIRAITYSNFMPLIAIAVIYLILVLGLSYLVSLLERRLRKSEK